MLMLRVPATVTLTWTCDQCGATAGWEFDADEASVMNLVGTDDRVMGWRAIDGRAICPRHRVVVERGGD